MARTPIYIRNTLLIVAIASSSAALGGEVHAQQKSSSPPSNSGTYILGPTDRVRVKVYGEPDVAGEYEVDATGYVSIPLAGRVKASGLTTRQLERSITSALSKGIVRDPRVNVEIALYRPFYILGEVKKSGEYPYRVGMTVLDAIASAGGFTYRANENKVYLRRSGSPVEEIYPLDMPLLIYPGDNIRIPERFF